MSGLMVVLLLVSLDWVTGVMGNALLARVPAVESLQSSMCQSILHQQADVIVLGSSRARHHYSTRMIAASLGMTCYNAGIDGHDMLYAYVVFRSMVERHCPRVVILDVCNNQVNGRWKQNSLSDYKCLYGMNRWATQMVDEQEDLLLTVKMQSNMYRLNGVWAWLASSFFRRHDANNGYVPLEGIVGHPKDVVFEGFSADEQEVNCVKEMADICRAKGIVFYMAITPSYEIDEGLSRWFNGFLENHDVKGCDYTLDGRFRHHRELFKDQGHLNRQGAEKYTSVIVSQIAPLLQ